MARGERNTVLLLVVGVLAAISFVVAALVIFSSGGGPAEKPEATAAVRAGDQSVVVGRSSAPTKVVVYEDYASPESREFEIASRDFLRIEAARGRVQVEYRPYAQSDDGYSTQALQAWAGVLGAGTPKQALAFHDVLFDRQPTTGTPTPTQLVEWARGSGVRSDRVFAAMAAPGEEFVTAANGAAREAGVQRPPLVLRDGTQVSADSPTALADTLQRELLEEER